MSSLTHNQKMVLFGLNSQDDTASAYNQKMIKALETKGLIEVVNDCGCITEKGFATMKKIKVETTELAGMVAEF